MTGPIYTGRDESADAALDTSERDHDAAIDAEEQDATDASGPPFDRDVEADGLDCFGPPSVHDSYLDLARKVADCLGHPDVELRIVPTRLLGIGDEAPGHADRVDTMMKIMETGLLDRQAAWGLFGGTGPVPDGFGNHPDPDAREVSELQAENAALRTEIESLKEQMVPPPVELPAECPGHDWCFSYDTKTCRRCGAWESSR